MIVKCNTKQVLYICINSAGESVPWFLQLPHTIVFRILITRLDILISDIITKQKKTVNEIQTKHKNSFVAWKETGILTQ